MDVLKAIVFAAIFGMTAHVVADEPTPAQPAATSPAPTEAKQEPAAKSAAVEGRFDEDTIMAAQKAGYEIRNQNGEQLLCRKELKTGSHLRHSVSCLTPKQWEQLQSDTQQSLRVIERRRLPPKSN